MCSTNRPSWSDYFMALAEVTASRSTCPRASVGAVIVKDNHILVTGYNGAIHNAKHCTDVGCLMIDGHCMRAVHAEMNAIVNCARQGEDLNGATLYVTHFPCIRCMPLVLQAGISKIYYANEYRVDPYCLELAESSGCELIKINTSLDEVYAQIKNGRN